MANGSHKLSLNCLHDKIKLKSLDNLRPGSKSTHCAYSGSNGFTLMELLVAVFVLSFGLLGMANLQIVSTRSNFEAVQRTQATHLANDAIYRMRANSERLDVYALSDLGGGTITDAPSHCTDTMTAEECLTAMANRDRWELEQAADNADTLIDPRVCITHDVANPGNVTVVVAWRGISESTASSADSLDACGKTTIDTDHLKQVIIDTFITAINPY